MRLSVEILQLRIIPLEKDCTVIATVNMLSVIKICMLCCEGVPKEEVSEVYMGNVYQASLGQNPARQAALFAGLLSICFVSLAFVVSCFI